MRTRTVQIQTPAGTQTITTVVVVHHRSGRNRNGSAQIKRRMMRLAARPPSYEAATADASALMVPSFV